MSVIALDIGRSAVKVAVSNPKGVVHSFIFPTAVCLAFGISDATEAARAAKETVRVGSRDYFIGETALTQGGSSVTGGLSGDWIHSDEHTALLLGAYQRALPFAGSKKPKVGLGLPMVLFKNQQDALREMAMKVLELDDVFVMPQPMAPYWELMLKADGTTGAAVKEESWAVVDIGHYTTDFMLMMNGRWVEVVSGSCSGAHVATERLKKILTDRGMAVDLSECEKALREKSIKYFRETVNLDAEVDDAIGLLANEIVDTAKRLIDPYARKLNGVVVAGGGAGFMYDKLKDRWPHATMPQTPRMSVAEGMRRLGVALAHQDAIKE